MTQCNTQGCENEGHYTTLGLNQVDEGVIQALKEKLGRSPVMYTSVVLCSSCQTAIFMGTYDYYYPDGHVTNFDVSMQAVI